MLKDVGNLSSQLKDTTILQKRYNVLPFPESLRCLERDWDFEHRVRTMFRPVIVGCKNVELFAFPSAGRSFLHASVLKLRLSRVCRSHLNIPRCLSWRIFLIILSTRLVFRTCRWLIPEEEVYRGTRRVFQCRGCCSLIHGRCCWFHFWRGLAPVAVDVSSNDPLRRNPEKSAMHMKYHRLYHS